MPEFSTILSSMVGLGVGIDYALFIVTRYRQNLQAGMEPSHANRSGDRHRGPGGRLRRDDGGDRAARAVDLGDRVRRHDGHRSGHRSSWPIVAAITLLPALLGFAGNAIDNLSIHRKRKRDENKPAKENMWLRWGHERRASPVAVFHRRGPGRCCCWRSRCSRCGSGSPMTARRRRRRHRRQAYDLLSEGFGPGFNGPLLLAVEIADRAALHGLDGLNSAIAATAGRGGRRAAAAQRGRDAAIMQVIPTTSPQDEATDRPRRTGCATTSIPAADRRHGRDGATSAASRPRSSTSSDTYHERAAAGSSAPWSLLSFLLLMVVFRSVLVPLKAAVMNLLSIGAAYGVIVAVFQWGWGASLFGVERAGADRELRADDDVRHPVRSVDGLRGVPALPHPRGVLTHGRQRASAVADGLAPTAG